MTCLAFRLRGIFAEVQPPLFRHAPRGFRRMAARLQVIYLPNQSASRDLTLRFLFLLFDKMLPSAILTSDILMTPPSGSGSAAIFILGYRGSALRIRFVNH